MEIKVIAIAPNDGWGFIEKEKKYFYCALLILLQIRLRFRGKSWKMLYTYMDLKSVILAVMV